MQLANGLDETEAQTVAGGLSAAFNSRKSFGDAGKVRFRYTRAIVADLKASGIACRDKGQANYSSLGGVPLCILQHVDEGLREQLAITL